MQLTLKLLASRSVSPKSTINDKLRSHSAALDEIGPAKSRGTGGRLKTRG